MNEYRTVFAGKKLCVECLFDGYWWIFNFKEQKWEYNVDNKSQPDPLPEMPPIGPTLLKWREQ